MNMKMLKSLTAILSVTFTLALTASAQTLPPDATKTGVTYDGDIKAILDKGCVKCHSEDKPKAKLHLDTLAGILKGDRDGAVLTAGNSASSSIVQAAAHTTDDPDEWMPPTKDADKFPALTADQIGLLRAWIDQGAK
jgi:hypothetical protein